MILKGLRFGMLLQLAVGPMCLLTFKTAGNGGFLPAFMIVLAVSLIDALYIFLALCGAARLLQKSGVQRLVRIFACLFLVLFGLYTIWGALRNVGLPPAVSLPSDTAGGIFVQGLVLTASNPLTILFWSGVFSAQLLKNRMSIPQLAAYGAGCVLSTLLFLSAVAAFGSIANAFLPPIVIRVLNALVGVSLIVFGIRMFFGTKEHGPNEAGKGTTDRTE